MRSILLPTLIACITLAAACKKDSSAPTYAFKQRDVTIHFDETHKFEVTENGNTANPNSFTFYSSDINVGVIDNNGVFTANRIGESEITADGPNGASISAKVTVEPYYTLYREPSIQFGASISDVKAYETRGLGAETVSSLLYEGENESIAGLMYLFDNNKLTSAIVMLPSNDEAFTEKLATFYMERYAFEGESDDVFFFSDEASGVIIGIGIMETFGLTAAYFGEESQQAMKALSSIQKPANGDRPDIKSILRK